MKPPQQINAINLIPQLDKLLIELLENLSMDEWLKQTIAPQWKVKDVAAHLLDGNLRSLSILRDNFFGEDAGEINSYQDLVGFLNDLNADWVRAMKRLSPTIIIELLKTSGVAYCELLRSLPPEESALFSVAWAGENESKNWFHVAREYTEKWHHQQQIRLTVGKDDILLNDKWYYPYLNTSVRGLPHHYKNVQGEENDLVQFTFKGKTEKSWFLQFENDIWKLYKEIEEIPTCKVIIPDHLAWRIFTKGIEKEKAIQQSEIIGKSELGMAIFSMLAVMA